MRFVYFITDLKYDIQTIDVVSILRRVTGFPITSVSCQVSDLLRELPKLHFFIFSYVRPISALGWVL